MADLFEASARIKLVIDKTQISSEAKAASEHLAANPPTVGIKPKINKADTEKEVEQGIVGPLKASAGTIASTIGLLGLGAVLKGGFDELKQQQDVLTQTNALLKATGSAAGVTSEQIAQLAETEQDKTGKDKEAIQAGENQLLQFTNVRNQLGQNNDIFTQASKLAIDLSQATGQDLSAAYVTLGRALQDPVQGSRALKAAHVVLTASDRELIKSLEDQGKTLEAQQFILGKVKGQVEGLAEAHGQTLAGQVERAKNKLDDAKASIVAGFSPAIVFASDVVSKFADVIQSVPGPILAISASLLAVGLAAGPVSKILSGIGSAAGLVADGLRLAISQAAAMSGSFAGIGAAAGPAVAGLAAVTAYTIAYKKALEEATEQAGELTKKGLDKGLAGSRQDALDQINRIQQQAASIDQDINNLHFYDATKSNDLTIWKNGLAAANNELVVLVNQSDDLAQATGKSSDETFNWLKRQKELGITYATNEEALAAYTGAVDDGSTANDSMAESTDKLKKQQDDATAAYKSATDAISKLADAQSGLIGSNLSYSDAQRAVNSAERDVAQVQRDHAQAVRDASKAQDDYNAVLRDPKADARARADALAHLQDAQRKASPQQLADDEAEARSKLEKAIDNQAKAAADLAAQQAQANGQTLDGAGKLAAYRGELDLLEQRFPELRGQLQGFTGDLNALPATKDVEIKMKADEFRAQIQALVDSGFLTEGQLNASREATKGQRSDYGGRAGGGPVQGGIYEVNEQGIPETLTINGRQYLLVPPGQSGQVNALSAQGNVPLSTYHPFESQAADDIIARAWGGGRSDLFINGDESAPNLAALGLVEVDGIIYTKEEASRRGTGGGGRPAGLSGGYGTTSNPQPWMMPTFNINHPHPEMVAREVVAHLTSGFNPRQAA